VATSYRCVCYIQPVGLDAMVDVLRAQLRKPTLETSSTPVDAAVERIRDSANQVT
jgi:hypothetical protein